MTLKYYLTKKKESVCEDQCVQSVLGQNTEPQTAAEGCVIAV